MNVLILCTGNSCRSQMAHGFLQAQRMDWRVASAGTNPAVKVHPLAVRVMAEKGWDISGHRPCHVEDYLSMPWDYVITVCGGANEVCPTFLGQVKHRLHIGFNDPAEASGSKEEVLAVFRKIRDEIVRDFSKFLERME